MSSRGVKITAAAAVTLVLCAGAFPFVYSKKLHESKNLQHQEAALAGSQITRGAYVNTGSKDAGRDPDWDFEKRTWRGRPMITQRNDQ